MWKLIRETLRRWLKISLQIVVIMIVVIAITYASLWAFGLDPSN